VGGGNPADGNHRRTTVVAKPAAAGVTADTGSTCSAGDSVCAAQGAVLAQSVGGQWSHWWSIPDPLLWAAAGWAAACWWQCEPRPSLARAAGASSVAAISDNPANRPTARERGGPRAMTTRVAGSSQEW
jgi:hypothetical protein